MIAMYCSTVNMSKSDRSDAALSDMLTLSLDDGARQPPLSCLGISSQSQMEET